MLAEVAGTRMVKEEYGCPRLDIAFWDLEERDTQWKNLPDRMIRKHLFLNFQLTDLTRALEVKGISIGNSP